MAQDYGEAIVVGSELALRDRRAGGLSLLPAAAVTLLALGGGAVAGYAPPPEGQMAVLFAPWVSEGEALRTVLDAGGRFVGPGRFGNLVIAYGLDPDFGVRVRASGAWLTLAASGLCSPARQETEAI